MTWRIAKFVAVVCFAAVVATAGLLLRSGGFDLSSACEAPIYAKAERGLTKSQVESIFGKPNRVLMAHGDSNFLGQQNPKIVEAWIYIYTFRSGHIEIYFDATGMTVGRNCGEG